MGWIVVKVIWGLPLEAFLRVIVSAYHIGLSFGVIFWCSSRGLSCGVILRVFISVIVWGNVWVRYLQSYCTGIFFGLSCGVILLRYRVELSFGLS